MPRRRPWSVPRKRYAPHRRATRINPVVAGIVILCGLGGLHALFSGRPSHTQVGPTTALPTTQPLPPVLVPFQPSEPEVVTTAEPEAPEPAVAEEPKAEPETSEPDVADAPPKATTGPIGLDELLGPVPTSEEGPPAVATKPEPPKRHVPSAAQQEAWASTARRRQARQTRHVTAQARAIGERDAAIERMAPMVVPDVAGGGGDGLVHVKGYTRKDGTVVQPYTRSRPRR